MASPQHGSDDYWGYLINPDKSATPRLIQLCEGLATIISRLEPGPHADLTPQRLSAFYRSVGGNDYVFRELRYPGLSLMYKTLGCFHSLQPTTNAFDAPSVPCLLVPGFIRWQTVQLLLQPSEQARCIQRAVELYDVPAHEGCLFPKTIPREAFPSKPDEAMERWQNTILERLDDGPKKIKGSPYASPYDPADREGYFPRGGTHSRRTSRPPRADLQEPPPRLSPFNRRRSSVSNVPSAAEPPEAPDVNYHWASDQAFSAPNSATLRPPRPRTSAAQRPPSQSHHRVSNPPRPSTSGATSPENTPKTFGINFENFHLPFISSPFASKKHKKRSSASPAPPSSHHRSPRPYEAVSTGSEASSEDSLRGFPQFDSRTRRRSLAPSDVYNRSQRRHSHDASYQQKPGPPSGQPPPRSPHPPANYPRSPAAVPHPSAIRDDLFQDTQRTASTPEAASGNPTFRVVDPMGSVDNRGRAFGPQSPTGNIQGRRAASVDRRSHSADRRHPVHDGSHGDHGHQDYERDSMRKQGKPLRINTVGGAGAGSRRPRPPEIRSAASPGIRRVPAMGLSGGGRR